MICFFFDQKKERRTPSLGAIFSPFQIAILWFDNTTAQQFNLPKNQFPGLA
jgi:hypothetical protein